ncbi:MAG TPA: hypothetical protein VKU36_03390 [Candidatus Babeliales bacterium]|nr:hypothetical protein [Candidatus Babeliales bacterium]
MKKYIIGVLQIITLLHGMEKQDASHIPYIYTICEWSREHSNKGQTPFELAYHHIIAKEDLRDLIVFNVTNNKGLAACLAEKAAIVHAVDEEFSTDIKATQKKYHLVPNLIFRNSVEIGYYDLFSAFHLPSNENDLRKNLLIYKEGLKPHGKVFASIITQSNDDPIEEVIAQNIYTEIYNQLSKEDQKRRKEIIYSKENFITQETLEKVIDETGYTIISQINRFFKIHVKNDAVPLLKKSLNAGFSDFLSEKFISLSEHLHNVFCKKYVKSLMQKLKKDNQQECIYPYNFMQIHLQKK